MGGRRPSHKNAARQLISCHILRAELLFRSRTHILVKVDFYICPACGAEVRVGSKGCPKCASQRATKKWGATEERKSWEQDDVYDDLDLPDDQFDYDKFIQEEFERTAPRKTAVEWLWWLVALILLMILVGIVVAGFWQ
jgi:hypothetical protein